MTTKHNEDLSTLKLNNNSDTRSAAIEQTPREVNCLIRLGFKLDSRDCLGNTPLHYAVRLMLLGHGSLTTDMLLDAGADPAATNHKGQTALQFGFACISPPCTCGYKPEEAKPEEVKLDVKSG